MRIRSFVTTNLRHKDWHSNWQIFTVGLFAFLLSLPCEARVKNDSTRLLQEIQYLSSSELTGRYPGTAGSQLARDLIIKNFKEAGLKAFGGSYEQSFEYERGGEKIHATNLFAYIPGQSDKWIVISAHYDHLGEKDGKIYHGADDNASGTAALLHMLRHFSDKRFPHNLLFLACDAEEGGIRGSRYFVNHAPIPLEKILLNLNMDMISRNNKSELYLAGTYHYPHLKEIIKGYVQASSFPQVLLGHDRPNTALQDWTRSSDHIAFHEKKVPFIYAGVEDHPDYHQPADTFENIQPSFYYHTVKWLTGLVEVFMKGF